jgi:nicotinamide phosphoribosyltransferase
MRKVVLKYLEATGTPELIDFKVHDFGYRGSTSEESAGIGGSAHLVNFMGTDTMAALRLARDYYGEPMAGFSIPAMEHSTVTSWGRGGEKAAYENMLDRFPTGIIAAVSDSYDVYNACSNIWGKELKDKVLARDGVLVIRPDSGEPADVVLNVLDLLGKAFGTTTNSKGYLVLPPQVRVIQGDGIDLDMIGCILGAMKYHGWSADNIAFGSGGGLLQKVDRDTQKFAFKCSAAKINGEWRDVMKDPITDPGKRSKAGRLELLKEGKGVYTTIRWDKDRPLAFSQLRTVFHNGGLLVNDSFADIRGRARQ